MFSEIIGQHRILVFAMFVTLLFIGCMKAPNSAKNTKPETNVLNAQSTPDSSEKKPDAQPPAKAQTNILFIIDSSGSIQSAL